MAKKIENTSTFLKNITNYCTDCGEEQDCRKIINTDKGFVAALNGLEQELSDYKGPINPEIIESNTDAYLLLLKENNNLKELCDDNTFIRNAVKDRVKLLMRYDDSIDIKVAAEKDLGANLYKSHKPYTRPIEEVVSGVNPFWAHGGKLTLPISLSRFMKKFAKSKRVTKKKRAAKKTKRKVSKKSKKPKSRKQRK